MHYTLHFRRWACPLRHGPSYRLLNRTSYFAFINSTPSSFMSLVPHGKRRFINASSDAGNDLCHLRD
jgi:hypothetical protein